MTYKMNWDLDSIFPGGSESIELQNKLYLIKEQLVVLASQVDKWNSEKDKPHFKGFSAILDNQEKITFGLSQVRTFVEAIQSADVTDKNSGILFGKIFTLSSSFDTIKIILTKKMVAMTDKDWAVLLSMSEFQPIDFVLQETRTQGKELLNESEEALINTLSIDGFQAWSDHYDTLVATITIPFEETDGTISTLSAGQAYNKMNSDPNKDVRKQLFDNWEAAWAEKAPLFANTLNHLAGFRLANYKAHGVSDFLKRPLEYNRMNKETLDAMWKAVSEHKQSFIDFLNRKAKLMGKEQLDWQDIESPVLVGNAEPQIYPYNKGANFIIENFKKVSPKMSSFAQSAFEKNWIEAENRNGKRPGGYCAELPESKESRIFMTYADSPGEVSTLAHELGHAFHSDVMKELPVLNQQYAMNVAETASTFAEIVVADATVKDAQSKEEKINLLDTKIQNSLAMFLNIHARFIFETNFYAERQNGIVTEAKLSELMDAAQREAYKDSLSSYHPHFWASKLHFFIADVPFYNFPYTFGYLFSLGIYAQYLEDSNGFEDRYIALLKDTASMSTEDLAKKHLHVDLAKQDFWVAGIEVMEKEIQSFLELTDEYLD
ncbi:oligoendopeptidase, pepF/M3 family [Carnobacterium iners]|uniref:Oligoendopeptidase, pepF/M3 family n=1 Tax=Carnobacterium iners TaxID=1073423 RepID=A0A1X7NTB9_9LACT|nr:M3 family oligoendopeptidase [Carnobacterium iners]SEK88125.1 oligoendopeptidase, pepF/M3 family [Carnobacterium iners]SMH40652.1 oligoendopeptidase, pepF/M3 family [Carnobacterium iners]